MVQEDEEFKIKADGESDKEEGNLLSIEVDEFEGCDFNFKHDALKAGDQPILDQNIIWNRAERRVNNARIELRIFERL